MNYPRKKNIKVRSNERIYEFWQWIPGGTTPQDFGGWTVKSKVREDRLDRTSTELDDWTEFITLNENPEGDAEDGWIKLEVPLATVEDYTWTVAAKKIGYFDIVVIDGASKPKTLIAGSVRIFEGMA